MATSWIVRTLIAGGFAVSAGFLIAVTGAATASADGLTTQTGGSVDYDGTNGTSWNMATGSSSGHSITSDACFVVGKGCVPGSSNPSYIAETTGTSDKPGSAMDPDGYQASVIRGMQAAAMRGPAMVAVPQTTAH